MSRSHHDRCRRGLLARADVAGWHARKYEFDAREVHAGIVEFEDVVTLEFVA